MTIMSAIPAYEAERNRQAGPTDSERLIARAHAAITSLRHGADTGHCDAAKARKLADTIQRQLCAPHDTHLIFGSYPQGSDVWATLATWKEWIDMFARQTSDGRGDMAKPRDRRDPSKVSYLKERV